MGTAIRFPDPRANSEVVDVIEHLVLQFQRFPGAETIHSLQGVIVGILLARGYLKESLARVGVALTLMAAFAIYEGYERWRIGDEADLDFAAMLVAAWISTLVTLAIHLIRNRKSHS